LQMKYLEEYKQLSHKDYKTVLNNRATLRS
jgi:hypothetical protein